MVKNPNLVIILGTPASGKTTLARRLAMDLSLPCLCKDDIKETLFDVLGATDDDGSRRLSEASFAALLKLAHAQLGSSVSCIVEGNWRPAHAAKLRVILGDKGARSVQVCCTAPAAEIHRRFAERSRHAGHRDAFRSSHSVCELSRTVPAFLELDGPRVLFATGNGTDTEAAYREVQHALAVHMMPAASA